MTFHYSFERIIPMIEISYAISLNLDEVQHFDGFFVDWPNPPTEETFISILKGSYKIVLALDSNRLVGFITSTSDGVLSAYIPLLEVLPNYQGIGIGKKLLSIMKSELSHLYMIDLLCDEGLLNYYDKQGMSSSFGAIIRNYDNQSGYIGDNL